MADYARGGLRGKRRELERALEGTFTEQQRWLLDKELRQVEWLEAQVVALEGEIERRMIAHEEPMRLLLSIPGVERRTAWTIIAEVGVDLSVFPDARHLASWAGLCPGNRESGGKRMSGRTRKANRYVKRVMCQAAWAASHTKDTYLSAFYRRMRVRKGPPKALIALAHHMITVVYHVLSGKQGYIELGGDYYDQQNKPKTVKRLVKRLLGLGYYVNLSPVEPELPDARLPAGELPAERPNRTDALAQTEARVIPESTATSAKRRRGRPCQCAIRGIPCKHGTSAVLNSLSSQTLAAEKFS